MRKCLLALLTLSLPAWAAPQAIVDAVQAPAWRERDGRAEALAPGMELKSRDRIRTGDGSRVYLRLADGSIVKVGENGLLTAERLGPSTPSFLSAALDVARGAFRFTTEKLRRPLQRDISIRVAAVTAGIRGTDVWGKSEPERDFVCLLEGRISVSHSDGDAREMDEPLTFYAAPRNRPPTGIEKADPETVRKWAAETEIVPGAGAARRGGKWKVMLGEADSQADALDLYDRAGAVGYAATIRPRRDGERYRYRVQVGQLPSKAEAEVLATRLKARLGVAAQPSL